MKILRMVLVLLVGVVLGVVLGIGGHMLCQAVLTPAAWASGVLQHEPEVPADLREYCWHPFPRERLHELSNISNSVDVEVPTYDAPQVSAEGVVRVVKGDLL